MSTKATSPKKRSPKNQTQKTTVEGISKNQLQRLAYKAGGLRISAKTYPIVRDLADAYLDALLQEARRNAGLKKRSTIYAADVKKAVKVL